jgi:uncharacterized damage-inducible protein DinB
MRKTILKAIVLITGISFYFVSWSQTSNHTLSLMDVKDQMVQDWERAKAYTIDYLNTMPAEKYTYKPNDSVRTFAGHMLHLAMVNVLFMATANDLQPLPWAQLARQNSPTAQNKDSVMYYVTASYDFAINAVKNSDVTKWGEVKTVLSHQVTRLALMNKIFEHQTHHRGQTTIYIRMQNITPPNERLF